MEWMDPIQSSVAGQFLNRAMWKHPRHTIDGRHHASGAIGISVDQVPDEATVSLLSLELL